MLKILQYEHIKWAKRNFENQQPWQPLLGIMEELGELAHAHLKQSQGIRNNENHEEAAKDAIGDIIIYLANYCNLRKFNLEQIVLDTWEQVKKRDWEKNPDTAHKGNEFEVKKLSRKEIEVNKKYWTKLWDEGD